jgi:radical SAM superfamily enzyme YgiQ (UPF0313 family)
MPLSPQELFCGSVGMFCLILTVSFKKHKDAEEDKLLIDGIKNPIVIQQPKEDALHDLIEQVEKLPESTLKRNLYTIIGAEYSGDAAQLNKLLQQYAQRMIEELQKDKGSL